MLVIPILIIFWIILSHFSTVADFGFVMGLINTVPIFADFISLGISFIGGVYDIIKSNPLTFMVITIFFVLWIVEVVLQHVIGGNDG